LAADPDKKCLLSAGHFYVNATWRLGWRPTLPKEYVPVAQSRGIAVLRDWFALKVERLVSFCFSVIAACHAQGNLKKVFMHLVSDIPRGACVWISF
jgi:hypothetical protein